MGLGIRKSVSALWLAAAVGCYPASASSVPPTTDPTHPDTTAAAFDQSLHDAPDADALAAELRRQQVPYPTPEPPGTIVIDTPHTYLYYVLGDGQAIRYGIGVGREGFTWSGVQRVSRKAVWPSWAPPREMIKRQQYLPRWLAGGPDNPLGARALYLGNTEYRIHGTNDPSTVGQSMSSGCFRLTNHDIIDLYGRTNVGTKVVVLPATPSEDVTSDDRHPTTRRASRHAAGRRTNARRAVAHQAAPPRQPAPPREASQAVGWGTTASSVANYGWH
jgi:lipoprotein-anchoring transpeptidase ErfK/SrfK